MEGVSRQLVFGDFELDGAKRLLYQHGEPVPLNAKGFDLLLALIERPGEVLSKDELMQRVWPGQFVEEGNLAVQISALRKIFGERKDEHRFIVTVPGRGYAFVADVAENRGGDIVIESHSLSRIVVEEQSAENDLVPPDETDVRPRLPAAPSSWRSRALLFGFPMLILAVAGLGYWFFSGRTPSGASQVEAIAVLPFVNIRNDPKMEYLSDGITESLINFLSQSSDLKVIASSSVFRYKANESQTSGLDLQKVARELSVQVVLTGKVEQRGEDLFISAELVDIRDNTHLWGEQYIRKFTDVFVVQEEIASHISQKLRLKLSGEGRRETARRYTDNLKAFESYMMGRSYVHRRTREDLLIATRYFEQAIKEDQNYTLAYTGLVEAYGSMGVRGYISSAEARQKVDDAAQKAVLLDDNLAEAHAALGATMTLFAPYNFPDGDRELRRAIELSPSLAQSHLYLSLSLLRQGRLDEGLTEMLKARELDPFSAIIARQVALYYNLKRDHVRALEILRQANEMGFSFTTTVEINIYIQNRSYEEALVELEKARQQRKDDSILIYSLGMVYAAQGKRAEALATIKELERLSGTDFSLANLIARIYVLLGEKEQAFISLERGFEAGSTGTFYKDEPVWDALRNDSRFAGLLLRMKIPQ